MKNWKKAAALFCGTAAAMLFAAHALSAFAFESVELADRMDQLTDGITGILADEVYAEPGETVEFSVMIGNNIGYTNIGISLMYDEQLAVILNDRGRADLTYGPASADLVHANTLNTERCVIGYTSMGDVEVDVDGVIFTAKFTVPADAEIGTVYPMELHVENLTDRLTRPQVYTVVDGWIEVYRPETTTAATTTAASAATTGTSATTAATTQVTEDTETTTEETTSERITQDSSAVRTTTSTTLVTDSSTEKSTKKTDRDPTREVTTSGKGGTGSSGGTKSPTTVTTPKIESSRTGDAGAGAAAAAGVLAGITAIFFRKRKH